MHETAAAIQAAGGDALAVPTDVRKEDEIDALVATTVETWGGLDIYVHNAGALFWKDVEDTPLSRFDLVMDVNARAAFAGAHAALPHMKARGGGHILVFSPPIEPALAAGKVAYFISKYGMTLLAHGLAEEVRGDGIAVNALWPATLIESQATINHNLGAPALWRKTAILTDAVLVILSRTAQELTGRAIIDEDILRENGVEDFDTYNCVESGNPLRIVGAEGKKMWDRMNSLTAGPKRSPHSSTSPQDKGKTT